MKAAADLVVHPAARHFGQRVDDDVVQRTILIAPRHLHQKVERHRRRKLRRAAKTAIHSVVALGDAGGRAIERVMLQRAAALKLDRAQSAQHFGRGRIDLRPIRVIRMRDMLEHPPESRHAVPVLGREIRS